jgi:hypothetical protein
MGRHNVDGAKAIKEQPEFGGFSENCTQETTWLTIRELKSPSYRGAGTFARHSVER